MSVWAAPGNGALLVLDDGLETVRWPESRVRILSTCIRRGELRCLIGPNGAGKSTVFKLMRCESSIPPPARSPRSTARISGRWPTWRRARQGLSIKMQIPGIYPELTVP